MFKVECPGCKAPYQVDERRIPANGLKMRCPKCGSSFKVDSPSERSAPAAGLGAVLGVNADSFPPPALNSPPAARPAAEALATTMLGVAPPVIPPRPAAPPVPGRAKPAADLPAVPKAAPPPADLPAVPKAAPPLADLPAPAAPRRGGPPPPPRPKPAAPPGPAAPPAPRPAPRAALESGLELDLPMPSDNLELPDVRGAASRPSSPSLELDLPVPGGARSAPPRAGTASSSGFGEIELDLPAPAAPVADLPAPRAADSRAPRGAALPAVVAPAAARKDEPRGREVELPSLMGGGAPRIAADLPSPSLGRASAPELPSLGGAGKTPARSLSGARELDLPALGDAALPVPAGVGLPAPASAGLPVPSSAGLPSAGGVSLPALSAAGLPTPGGAGLPSAATGAAPFAGGGQLLDLDGPTLPGRNAPSAAPLSDRDILPLDLEEAAPAAGASDFGVLDLEAIPARPSKTPAAPSRFEESLDSDPFGEAPLPPPRSLRPGDLSAPQQPQPIIPSPASIGSPVIRQAGGGTAYGEVDLGGDAGSDVSLEAPAPRPRMPSDEDMEFSGVPQEQAAPVSARAPVAAPASAPATAPVPVVSQRAPRATKPRAKLPIRALAGVFVVLVGGAALSFVPDVGPFGAHWIIDRVRADEYARALADVARAARSELQKDTAPDAARALQLVEERRATLPRVRTLSAYSAFLCALRELRFGADAEAHARGKVLLDELASRDDVAYLELARAARAGVDGQLARARQGVATVLARSRNDADALALSGEVELKAHDPKAALAAWQALGQAENSARAHFGVARARFSADDVKGAEGEAKAVLERNPAHVGAKILLARIAAESSGREAEAIRWLDQIAKAPERASADERVSASTLLGEIHLGRSRISRAEAAFTEALRINPKAARALMGLGETLYRAGRYSEAQARFEAGAQADPDDILAKVGVAKCKLMLERVEEANALLKRLRETHPKSVPVAYWYGRVLETLGDRAQAEKVYKQAIAQDKVEPLLVETYIGLALLQNQEGRSEEAKKTLVRAQERMPASAAIHVALGDVALTQGRYADAQAEFRKALQVDPEDLAARHKLGVALRRDGKFDEALKLFDEVAAIDPEYPGLALERGLVYEASGRTEEALKAYEGALPKAPDDPDLQLRVGCAYAAAGRTKEAEALLRKVLAQRPTSAETNHCLGRALLAEGSRLADAVRLLDRAVELDPNRAEYHLYVGWAANEAGQVAKAERALNQAIALDQSLADAYWQRGVLRQRQGAVKDAILDLTRCLQLRPTRYEAHATLAQAYYDQGNEKLALAEWQKAVTAQPENATWHFHYGKLLDDNRMLDAARVELTRALELLEKKDSGERWGWDAHRRLARTLGQRQEAVPHWEAFLRQGPLDSPYRAEAMAALEKLGHPWRPDSGGLPPSAPGGRR